MSNVFLSKREFFLKILWIKKMILILRCGGWVNLKRPAPVPARLYREV